jgi:hypothetical protein
MKSDEESIIAVVGPPRKLNRSDQVKCPHDGIRSHLFAGQIAGTVVSAEGSTLALLALHASGKIDDGFGDEGWSLYEPTLWTHTPVGGLAVDARGQDYDEESYTEETKWASKNNYTGDRTRLRWVRPLTIRGYVDKL